jgi:hypothetical protein
VVGVEVVVGVVVPVVGVYGVERHSERNAMEEVAAAAAAAAGCLGERARH